MLNRTARTVLLAAGAVAGLAPFAADAATHVGGRPALHMELKSDAGDIVCSSYFNDPDTNPRCEVGPGRYTEHLFDGRWQSVQVRDVTVFDTSSAYPSDCAGPTQRHLGESPPTATGDPIFDRCGVIIGYREPEEPIDVPVSGASGLRVEYVREGARGQSAISAVCTEGMVIGGSCSAADPVREMPVFIGGGMNLEANGYYCDLGRHSGAEGSLITVNAVAACLVLP